MRAELRSFLNPSARAPQPNSLRPHQAGALIELARPRHSGTSNPPARRNYPASLHRTPVCIAEYLFRETAPSSPKSKRRSEKRRNPLRTYMDDAHGPMSPPPSPTASAQRKVRLTATLPFGVAVSAPSFRAI